MPKQHPRNQAQPHPAISKFFQQSPPESWTVFEFHNWFLSQKQETGKWRSKYIQSLNQIASCTSGCCPPLHKITARHLLAKWNQKGVGSDKHISKTLPSSSSSSSNPVHIGHIFQAPVNTANCNQTTHLSNNNDSDKGDSTMFSSQGDEGDIGEDYIEEFSPGADTCSDSEDSTNAQPVLSPTLKSSSDFHHIIENFKTSYRDMSQGDNQRHKLILCSGRAVEDVIYDHAISLNTPAAAHFWVLDMSDSVVQNWFTTDEWNELKLLQRPAPPPCPILLRAMSNFAPAQTIADFRRIATKTPNHDETASCSRHDLSWLHTVVNEMADLLESSGSLLTYPSSGEGVYDARVWGPIVDKALGDLAGLILQRKEISSRALSSMPHAFRPQSRFDGIVVSRTSHHDHDGGNCWEYGAIEVSRASIKVGSKKWQGDSFKVVGGLHAMLCRLKLFVNDDPEIVKKLQVAGLVHAGLYVQVLRMTCVSKYMFFLALNQVRSVPTSVRHLKSIFPLMTAIWTFKKIILECSEVVATYVNTCAPEDPDDMFNNLVELGSGF